MCGSASERSQESQGYSGVEPFITLDRMSPGLYALAQVVDISLTFRGGFMLVNIENDWLTVYKAENKDHLDSEPEFAAWLESQYVPIAGGWQY
jgi:hypothetical protein